MDHRTSPRSEDIETAPSTGLPFLSGPDLPAEPLCLGGRDRRRLFRFHLSVRSRQQLGQGWINEGEGRIGRALLEWDALVDRAKDRHRVVRELGDNVTLEAALDV